MSAAIKKISDEQAVNLVRNALLVAGTEMGAEGDHWPVINDTIHKVMKDWEDLKIERNVHAEFKTQVYAQLDKMDEILKECTPAERAIAEPKIRELREIYNAYFTPVDESSLSLADEDTPIHVRRAEEIISTLED